MPNINEAFPSNYIKASDLKGRQVSVKMDRAEYEMIGNDKKLILYFVGKDKGMVLNKTNANNIAAAYGEDTDDWRDQEITLFEAMVDYQGKTVPAIRIRVPPRRPATNGNYELKEHGQFSTGGPRNERSPQPPMQRGGDDPDDTIPF